MDTLYRVLVTGSKGFIGKNLVTRLQELPQFEVVEFCRSDDPSVLPELIAGVDAVVHLAGENRPKNEDDFTRVNTQLTEAVCEAIRAAKRPIPIILASSAQAEQENLYGKSKFLAENAVEKLGMETGNPALIYRLPGVFGKWCKPHYNSVVATFCHNLSQNLPIQINDPSTQVRLVYVDDVVKTWIGILLQGFQGVGYGQVTPEYTVSLGELADQLQSFKACRISLEIGPVGTDLTRALYATYISYFLPDQFAYELTQYKDPRGVFVEMLKTPQAGQFSYFTAHPGITRGGHYHHTKNEKFLVVKGKAKFGFRHILSNETYEILTSGEVPTVVDTIPGWAHDITNIGEEEMVVLLWANEIFDRENPDTISSKVLA